MNHSTPFFRNNRTNLLYLSNGPLKGLFPSTLRPPRLLCQSPSYLRPSSYRQPPSIPTFLSHTSVYQLLSFIPTALFYTNGFPSYQRLSFILLSANISPLYQPLSFIPTYAPTWLRAIVALMLHSTKCSRPRRLPSTIGCGDWRGVWSEEVWGWNCVAWGVDLVPPHQRSAGVGARLEGWGFFAKCGKESKYLGARRRMRARFRGSIGEGGGVERR